ncbi:hypothetical protein C8J56DRAFT_799289 [Mycena floridula]|nr:hypothetical protein C8J56DRAFT_799289 [Mycena floridula]
MTKALADLDGVKIEEWKELLKKWQTWEGEFGFGQAGHNQTKLGTKFRPAQVEWWTKRKGLSMPELGDLEAFAKKWWQWWIGVNPEWRSETDRVLNRNRTGSWDALDISGINGFLSPLMCLRWWFEAGTEVNKDPLWAWAVSDIAWVIEHLLDSCQ